MSDDWRAIRNARMNALESTVRSPANRAPSTSAASGSAQGSTNVLGSDGVLTRADVKRDRVQLVLDSYLSADSDAHIVWNPVGSGSATFVNDGGAHVSEGEEGDEEGCGQGVPILEAILARPAVTPRCTELSSEINNNGADVPYTATARNASGVTVKCILQVRALTEPVANPAGVPHLVSLRQSSR